MDNWLKTGHAGNPRDVNVEHKHVILCVQPSILTPCLRDNRKQAQGQSRTQRDVTDLVPGSTLETELKTAARHHLGTCADCQPPPQMHGPSLPFSNLRFTKMEKHQCGP